MTAIDPASAQRRAQLVARGHELLAAQGVRPTAAPQPPTRAPGAVAATIRAISIVLVVTGVAAAVSPYGPVGIIAALALIVWVLVHQFKNVRKAWAKS